MGKHLPYSEWTEEQKVQVRAYKKARRKTHLTAEAKRKELQRSRKYLAENREKIYSKQNLQNRHSISKWYCRYKHSQTS